MKPFIISAIILALSVTVCPAETYTWTDKDGIVNFTDNPANVPKKYRTPSPSTNSELSLQSQPPDIVGYWSNEQDEFKTLNCLFKQDNTGVMSTAIGLQLPFSWQLQHSGMLEIVFKEIEPAYRQGGKAKNVERRTIQAEYDKESETIRLISENNNVILYRVEDAEYRAKKKSNFKQKQMYANDRLVLSDLTVYDVVTGLTWTRDGNLLPSGDVVDYNYAKRFIDDLNNKQYGGYSDWRLPSLKELQEIAQFGKGFYHETSPKSNPKNWGVASVFNGMGFVGVRPFFYWTSTQHNEFKGYYYCVSLTNGGDTFNIDYYTRHVWPVRRGN